MTQLDRYIIKDREQSAFSESFRAIRASIQAAQSERGVQTVLFVSACRGDSSSMTAANTAAALAYAGKQVILVDMDLRSPILHEVFKLKTIGVTNVIQEGKALPEALQPSGIDRLLVLTSGTPTRQPVEILANEKTRLLLQELKTMADYVIIASSPLIMASDAVVTDACILASKVDGVVPVIDSHMVRVHTAKKMMQLLKGAKANLMGTILNHVENEADFICSSAPAS